MGKNDDQFVDLDNPNKTEVSLREWFVTLFICFIPIVNIIMLLIWAFGGVSNPSKANFAKASLIFVLLYFLFITFFMWRYMLNFREMIFG